MEEMTSMGGFALAQGPSHQARVACSSRSPILGPTSKSLAELFRESPQSLMPVPK